MEIWMEALLMAIGVPREKINFAYCLLTAKLLGLKSKPKDSLLLYR